MTLCRVPPSLSITELALSTDVLGCNCHSLTGSLEAETEGVTGALRPRRRLIERGEAWTDGV